MCLWAVHKNIKNDAACVYPKCLCLNCLYLSFSCLYPLSDPSVGKTMFYERLFIWSGKGDVGPEFFATC